MELEKSFLYTHLGHSVYSDIEKIDNAIDLIIESMIAYKDNELKKLRLADVSRCFGEDDLRHVYEDIDTNYQSFEDWFKVYTSPI